MAVLRPSHAAVCESLLMSRQTLLLVARHDAAPAPVDPVAPAAAAEAARRRCGTPARPWTIATQRPGQRINVSVVDLARHPADSSPDDAAAARDDDDGGGGSISASACRRRFAHFSEPVVGSVSRDSTSRDRCEEEDGRGEASLYSSQTGRVSMVLDRRTTPASSDKFLLIFTGSFDR